jgi:hypothetical protein
VAGRREMAGPNNASPSNHRHDVTGPATNQRDPGNYFWKSRAQLMQERAPFSMHSSLSHSRGDVAACRAMLNIAVTALCVRVAAKSANARCMPEIDTLQTSLPCQHIPMPLLSSDLYVCSPCLFPASLSSQIDDIPLLVFRKLAIIGVVAAEPKFGRRHLES